MVVGYLRGQQLGNVDSDPGNCSSQNKRLGTLNRHFRKNKKIYGKN